MLRSTTSGAPLRSRATTRTVESAGGCQSSGTAKYRCTVTVCKNVFRLLGEDAEDEMLVDLHVGGRFQPIDQQFGRSFSGSGKQPFAVAVQYVVEELRLALLAEEERHAAAGRHVFLQGLDGRRVQPVDVRQDDRREIVQRLEAQNSAAFRSAAAARCGPTRPAPAAQLR